MLIAIYWFYEFVTIFFNNCEYSVGIENTAFGTRSSGVKYRLCHLLDLWSSVSYLTSLCLKFLVVIEGTTNTVYDCYKN